MPGPVGDVAAGHVARPDHDVGTRLRCRQELRQGGRVVGEVRIDLDEGVEALAKTPLEASPVSAAEAGLLRATQHVDRAEERLERLSDVRRPIRAAVVDDQDRRLGHVAPDSLEHRLDVHALVVGRDDHQHLHADDPR